MVFIFLTAAKAQVVFEDIVPVCFIVENCSGILQTVYGLFVVIAAGGVGAYIIWTLFHYKRWVTFHPML